METLIKIMGEKVNHKVKRVYPVLITDAEKTNGIKELSRLEIERRLKKLYAKKSFVAVSLSSNEFSENSVNEEFWRTEIILEWIAETFGQTDFLVSDSLYRFYNQILYGYNASRALEKGISDGKKFIQNCNEKISELGLNKDHFNFIKWSEITTELDFKILHEKFKQRYNNDDDLRNGIFESANIFLERNKERINIDIDLAKKLANEVIIEELALFAYMGELGYEGHIYPSTFMKILMDISASKYQDVPPELTKQTLIQIKIVTK